MCSRCHARDQYAPALAGLFRQVGAVLTTRPTLCQPPEAAAELATTCTVAATLLDPTKTAAARAQAIGDLSPQGRAVARSLLDLMGSCFTRAAQATAITMQEKGEQVPEEALLALREADGDDLDDDLRDDDFRDGAAMRVRGQAEVSLPSGITGAMRERIEAEIAAMAQRIAEITGNPVEVGHAQEMADGKLRPVGKLVAQPGQLPTTTSKIVH